MWSDLRLTEGQAHSRYTYIFFLNEGRKNGREGGRRRKSRTEKKCMCDGGPCECLWRGTGLGSVVVGIHRGSVKGSSSARAGGSARNGVGPGICWPPGVEPEGGGAHQS